MDCGAKQHLAVALPDDLAARGEGDGRPLLRGLPVAHLAAARLRYEQQVSLVRVDLQLVAVHVVLDCSKVLICHPGHLVDVLVAEVGGCIVDEGHHVTVLLAMVLRVLEGNLVAGVDDVRQVAGHDVVEDPGPHAALHHRGRGERTVGKEEGVRIFRNFSCFGALRLLYILGEWDPEGFVTNILLSPPPEGPEVAQRGKKWPKPCFPGFRLSF